MDKKIDIAIVSIVVLLLVVSIFSFFTGEGFNITGKSTENGTVNVTVTADVDLIAIDSFSDLGSLAPGESADTDTLTSQRMEFGNNGTSKIQVSVQAGGDLWDLNCPLGTGASSGSDNNCFNISCEDGLLDQRAGSGSECATGYLASGIGFNQTPIDSGDTLVTDLLGIVSGDDGDNFTVGWSVTVPLNEPTGVKTVEVVFTASEDVT